MLSVDEERALKRRGLVLEREILTHEHERLIDDYLMLRLDKRRHEFKAQALALHDRIQMIDLQLRRHDEVDAIVDQCRTPST